MHEIPPEKDSAYKLERCMPNSDALLLKNKGTKQKLIPALCLH
jgi:hypothetical protein